MTDPAFVTGALEDDRWLLHRLVLQGDDAALETALEAYTARCEALQEKEGDAAGKDTGAGDNAIPWVDAKDVHGNTPLQLASMLGRTACALHLLNAGAEPDIKNRARWPPIAEAISYGDPAIVGMLHMAGIRAAKRMFSSKSQRILKVFDEMEDFYLEIHWDIHSWVPLVSRVLPSDTMRLWKKGKKIRMDSTLLDVSEQSVKRGDMSFIFDAGHKNGLAVTAIDRVKREFKRDVVLKSRKPTRDMPSMEEVKEEVDWMLVSDLVDVDMSSKTVEFDRALSGWYGFREDKTEAVGSFQCRVYNVTGINLVTRTRVEFLSKEERKWYKDYKKRMKSGNGVASDEVAPERDFVPPDLEVPASWQEYEAREGEDPGYLGRPREVSMKKKSFKATAWMSDDFPMSLDSIIKLLTLLAPTSKHVARLHKFMKTKFPSGFPVKLDIPVFPTVSARITFQGCSLDPVDSTTFDIPMGYTQVFDEEEGGGEPPASATATERPRVLSRGANPPPKDAEA